MPWPSTIDRLPAEAREALRAWLRDPGVTQTEATERVNALLEDLGLDEIRVSLRTVSRYDLRLRTAGERVLQSRQIADAWIAKYGAAPDGPAGHLVIEILRAVAFDLASRLQDFEIDEKSLSGVVETATRISLMVQRLERSRETAVRCDREIKREAAEEAAAKAAGETKAGGGVSPERLREIMREIYGV